MRVPYRVALAVFVVVASHVGAFALISIVPRYKKRWDDFGNQLSLPQRLLVEVSDLLGRYWYMVLPSIVIVATLFVALPLLRSRPAERPTLPD